MAGEMQLIICLYNGEDKAEEVETALKALDERLDVVKLDHIAIVQKTPKGEIEVRQTEDLRDKVSDVAEGVAGGLADLLFTLAGGLGPAAGTMASYQTERAIERIAPDTGFSEEKLYEIGERLNSGHSALVTIVSSEEEAVVLAELERLGGTILTQPVSSEIVEQLIGETEA
jgi:uncharacterized membrane protein